jgi:hypothetical protein
MLDRIKDRLVDDWRQAWRMVVGADAALIGARSGRLLSHGPGDAARDPGMLPLRYR